MTRAWIVALVLAASAPARADMACFAGEPMGASPFPGAKRQIAGTGGVIVASGGEMPDWRFRDLNKIVRAQIVRIAPGLAIYHPPPLAGTDVILENATHDTMVQMTRALTAPQLPAAPGVEAITASGPGRSRTVVANLTKPTPSGVMLTITSRIEGKRLVPIAWARVNPGAALAVLWHTPGSCEQIVPTWVEPKPGDTVVVSWVDDTGRVSEPSKPIVISGASKRK